MPRGSRIFSGIRRVGVHLVNTLSNLLGDDIVSRWLRRCLLAAAGAELAATASLHGGTYFSRPLNLRAGARCFVNRNCHLDLEARIELGDDVVVGHGATLVTTAHAIGPPERRAGSVTGIPVVIQAGAWLGANCVILPGVTVGAGAVVAAGAVVIADVPPDVTVAGVPAEIVRKLDTVPGPPDRA